MRARIDLLGVVVLAIVTAVSGGNAVVADAELRGLPNPSWVLTRSMVEEPGASPAVARLVS